MQSRLLDRVIKEPLSAAANHSRSVNTFIKFILVGIAAFAVNEAALYLLYDWPSLPGMPDKDSSVDLLLFSHPDSRLLIASVIAVELSIVFKFCVHEYWTFADRLRRGWLLARLAKFNASSFLSPLIILGTVNVLTPAFGISPYVSTIIGAVIGFTVNWLLSAHFIWPGHKPAAEANPSA